MLCHPSCRHQVEVEDDLGDMDHETEDESEEDGEDPEDGEVRQVAVSSIRYRDSELYS